VSVGHVARLLEGAGIATVIIAVRSFRTRLEQLVLPRVVLTPHPLGRPLGPPGESEQQLKVLQAGLDLLENAKQGGVMVELESYYSFQVA
jgi:hypothetical protein